MSRHRTKPVRTQCRDCLSDLKKGARKCIICGSYQDWQGRIQTGQLLFGFILLILTLFALQPVKDLVLGTRPTIHAAILQADTEKVSIVISNSGNGTAALEGISITANKKGQGPWDLVFGFNDIPDRLLKPGDLKVVSFPHHHKIPQIADAGVQARKDCLVSVHYYELAGDHVLTGDYFRCYVDKNQ
jgi:hypothetical protein